MRVSFGQFIPVDVYMNKLEIPQGKRKPVDTDYQKLDDENFKEKQDIIKKFTSQMSFLTFPKDTALTEQQRLVFRVNNPTEYMIPRRNAQNLVHSEVISTDVAGQKYIVCGQKDVAFVKEKLKALSDELQGRGVSFEEVKSVPYDKSLYSHRVYEHKKVPYETAIAEYMNTGNRMSDKKLEIYATQHDNAENKYSISLIDFVNKETGKPVKFGQEV